MCGEEEEDAVHLWERCLVITDMGWTATTTRKEERAVTMGERTVVWTTTQLTAFLKLHPIVELLKPDGEER